VKNLNQWFKNNRVGLFSPLARKEVSALQTKKRIISKDLLRSSLHLQSIRDQEKVNRSSQILKQKNKITEKDEIR